MPELAGSSPGRTLHLQSAGSTTLLLELSGRATRPRPAPPSPPGCTFLPLTPPAMTKLSFKHKTFSQRGGAIGFGVRNAPTRLQRAGGRPWVELSPRPAAASARQRAGNRPQIKYRDPSAASKTRDLGRIFFFLNFVLFVCF